MIFGEEAHRNSASIFYSRINWESRDLSQRVEQRGSMMQVLFPLRVRSCPPRAHQNLPEVHLEVGVFQLHLGVERAAKLQL